MYIRNFFSMVVDLKCIQAKTQDGTVAKSKRGWVREAFREPYCRFEAHKPSTYDLSDRVPFLPAERLRVRTLGTRHVWTDRFTSIRTFRRLRGCVLPFGCVTVKSQTKRKGVAWNRRQSTSTSFASNCTWSQQDERKTQENDGRK